MEQFWAGVIMGMGVLEFALAVWVLAKDHKSRIHHYFSLFTLSLAGWTFINGIEVVLFPILDINWWERFLFFFAYAASFFGLQFMQVYPFPQPRRGLSIFSAILFIVVTVLLLFSDLIIARPERLNLANLQQLHFIYIAGFLINWISLFVLLAQARRQVATSLRQQVNLFLVAFSVGSIFGIYTSFIAPYLDPPQAISQLWAPGFAFIIFIFSVKVLRIAYKSH